MSKRLRGHLGHNDKTSWYSNGLLDGSSIWPSVLSRQSVRRSFSLCYDRWVRFRPLYRRRFLGSLATRYVGHSSRACKAGGSGQENIELIPQKACSSNIMRLNVASFMTKNT